MNRTTDKPVPATIQQDRELMEAREEGLLRRWSRRKAQARQETPSLALADVGETGAAESTAPANLPETSAPPVLTDADMPPIASLDKNSDYHPFMSPGVSEALRKRALQQLFHSGLFNERCPLDGEYYDCHGYEPLGSVITYDMREEMERTANALKEKAKQVLLDPEEKPPTAQTQPTTVTPRDESASPSTPDPDAVKEN